MSSDEDRARGRSKAKRRKQTSNLAAAGGLANVGVITAYQGGIFRSEDIDILECRDEVVKRIGQVHAGNTVHVAGLLMAQALALNSIFTKLAVQAAEVDARAGPQRMEAYLRLALKAQSQSRATLEAVLAVGNPPVLFAQQANVAFGQQQIINNPPPAATSPHAPGEQNAPNELSGEGYELLTDARASQATGRACPCLEPVEAVHRPTNC